MAPKPCYWHILLARSCDSWLQARQPQSLHAPGSGTVIVWLAGTRWRAWPSPALLGMDTASIHRQPQPGAVGAAGLPSSQQASCEPAVRTDIHTRLHRGAGIAVSGLPAPARSHGSQGPLGPAVQSRCSCCWESSRKHSTVKHAAGAALPACSLLAVPWGRSAPHRQSPSLCAPFQASSFEPLCCWWGRPGPFRVSVAGRSGALRAWEEKRPPLCPREGWGRLGPFLRQLGSAWLRHPAKCLRVRAAAGQFLSANCEGPIDGF